MVRLTFLYETDRHPASCDASQVRRPERSSRPRARPSHRTAACDESGAGLADAVPVPEPGILGVNAGAALGVILTISALGLPEIGQYTPFALLGAGCAAAAVYTISHRTIETGSLASSWPELP